MTNNSIRYQPFIGQGYQSSYPQPSWVQPTWTPYTSGTSTNVIPGGLSGGGGLGGGGITSSGTGVGIGLGGASSVGNPQLGYWLYDGVNRIWISLEQYTFTNTPNTVNYTTASNFWVIFLEELTLTNGI